jgi:hypothetical protein
VPVLVRHDECDNTWGLRLVDRSPNAYARLCNQSLCNDADRCRFVHLTAVADELQATAVPCEGVTEMWDQLGRVAVAFLLSTASLIDVGKRCPTRVLVGSATVRVCPVSQVTPGDAAECGCTPSLHVQLPVRSSYPLLAPMPVGFPQKLRTELVENGATIWLAEVFGPRLRPTEGGTPRWGAATIVLELTLKDQVQRHKYELVMKPVQGDGCER